jgi:hypothetical protein
MTYETMSTDSPAESSGSEKVAKKQLNIEEIVETLRVVREELGQINKLASEETLLVDQFFNELQKFVPSLAPSIDVSPSVLPIEAGPATQAQVDLRDT